MFHKLVQAISDNMSPLGFIIVLLVVFVAIQQLMLAVWPKPKKPDEEDDLGI